ncbi:PREDICTED: periodic tryptophan protein 2 homolog [Condylura cristata]|uniref:periodic tryptophan protein 2 homolog n=1 Tax=Condylura cristata TaxID=143302 RepID=UPI000643DD12|nr:PREDICTED: periodic tryptophan protein 2 homolog [Condylura cristata]
MFFSNRSDTLPLATRYNVKCVGLSPDGRLAIIVDEGGDALLVSLVGRAVLHRFHFQGSVHSVSFSPDGRKFVVTKGNLAQMYHAPGRRREFNAFVLDKTYFGPYDETTCVDWTDDSRCFAVGSKDTSTWVFGAERWDNLIYYALGGHKDAIVGCFFESDSLDLYTLSRDGALCVWQCDTPSAAPAPEEQQGKVKYSRLAKHFLNKEGDFTGLTAAAYHRGSHLLVTGFASGVFHLHELPDFSLIHSLSISDQSVSAVAINGSGDWVALGCSGLGQLLVWEWQSESYVFKQQGHFDSMVALAYSPDGQYIVTGGDDGKVKVWSTLSGFCFVTFTEHSSGVTGVAFAGTGYVVVTSSVDGTVRAFDLHRYRNFRTLTSPRPTQFSCVAVDASGEIVSAGAQDSFEVFVWSMQTGRLLDVLSGHEGPISGLCFNPTRSVLASASWDRTVRLWDLVDSWRTTETLALTSDALAVTFRPDGAELAVATLNAQITFWDPENAAQTGSIEGRHDLKAGRKELDKITAKRSAKGRCVSGPPGQQGPARAEPGILATGHGRSPALTALTGRSWAATTTEGLLIYSLDTRLLFDPFELDTSITPAGIRAALRQRDFTRALLMAARLNEQALLQEALEAVPWGEIEVVSSSLPEVYVEKVLGFLASSLEASRHLEFYLLWTQKLLLSHGQRVVGRRPGGPGTPTPDAPVPRSCDWNRYSLQYALALSRQRGVKRPPEPRDGEAAGAEDSEEDADSLHLLG